MDRSDQIVTVLGGGIVGVCCALSLLEKGFTVKLVDEGDFKRKASYGNAGVISPWSCVPQAMPGLWKQIPSWLIDKEGPVSFNWSYLNKLLPWVAKFLAAGKKSEVIRISKAMDALNRPNVEIYRQHLANTGRENLIKDACYLHVYRDKNAVSTQSLEYQLRKDNHAPMEVLGADQIKEIEPALSSDYQSALLIKNQARAISPGDLVSVLTDKFRNEGGELIKQKVKHIQPIQSGEWSVDCQGETLITDLLVIAAGTWSVDILRSLNLSFPLINERGYHLEFHHPNVSLNHSVMDVDSKFVTSSMANGIRSAGTAEFATVDTKPKYRRAKMLAAQTKRLLPDLNISNTSEWVGNRPSFPDGLPIIDKAPRFRNLFLAFGHSHYGLGMAPKTGQLLSSLVGDEKTDIDTEPYRYKRFVS